MSLTCNSIKEMEMQLGQGASTSGKSQVVIYERVNTRLLLVGHEDGVIQEPGRPEILVMPSVLDIFSESNKSHIPFSSFTVSRKDLRTCL